MGEGKTESPQNGYAAGRAKPFRQIPRQKRRKPPTEPFDRSPDFRRRKTGHLSHISFTEDKMKRKLLLLALVFALVVPSVASLVSCSRQGGGGQESAAGSDTDAETEGSPYLDNLPDDLNFNDAEIRFVYPEANVADIFTEDTGGELVAAAVYRTQMTVEDRLGVVYQINPLPYIRDQYTNQIRTSFSANENAYDIVGEMIGYAGGTVGMGAYADLNGTKYIDCS